MQRTLARGIAVMFTVIGAGAFIAPKLSAGPFGIPAADPETLAYVRAAGMRDVILGGIVFASLNDRTMLRRVLGWSSLVGLGDALVLAALRGARPQHVFHLGGFAMLASLALVLDA